MSNTIYLPQSGKGIGGALGEGMSTGIMKGLEKQEKAEKARMVGGMFEGIARSRDRKEALEKAGVMITQGAEDIADVSAVYAHVDRLFPIRDETPTVVEGVGPDNKPITRAVPRNQLGSLNTPEGAAATFGPGARWGKPEDELEFLRPPTPDSHLSSSPEAGNPPTSLGKFPVNKRPEGSISAPEWTMARQIAADKASIVSQDLARRSGERADASAVLAQEHLLLSQQREDRIAAELKRTKGEGAAEKERDNLRQDLGKLEGAVRTGLGKFLPDGTWAFTSDNERKLFYQRLKHGGDLMEEAYKGKGSRNYLSIAEAAVRQFPGSADKPEIEKPVVPPKPPAKVDPVSEALGNYAGEVKKNVKGLFGGKSSLPVVKTDADFEKLKEGTKFVDENGKEWTKPKSKKK